VTGVVQPPMARRVSAAWGSTATGAAKSAAARRCRRAHGLSVEVAGLVSRVGLQTFFREKRRYFVVTVAEVGLWRPPGRPAAGRHPPHRPTPMTTPTTTSITTLTTT
jgi:hypothetical protein